MKEKLILIGGGGHCRVILDTLNKINKYKLIGIIDLGVKIGMSIYDIPIVGTDNDLPKIFRNGVRNCFISIGSTGNPKERVKIYKITKNIGYNHPNIISPDSIISPRAVLGSGNFIGPGVIINSGARIGNNCIINTGAIVEHDCIISDFVHLSPGATLSGTANIGKNTHIGTASVIIQKIKVGDNCMIGAGSVVTKDIKDGVFAYGNPCKKRKSNLII